jgi:CcmD family protein
MSFRRLVIVLTSFVLLSTSAFALQPPVGQSEFVPVDSVPLADQLPAAPLLVTAYAFVWVAVMVYLWTIWRRLNKVETEMRALAQKQKTSQR